MFGIARTNNADSPRVYTKNVSLALERAINALRLNFSEIEGKLDRHVEAITNKKVIDLKMNETSKIIDSYKEEYYALLKRGINDSADTALLS